MKRGLLLVLVLLFLCSTANATVVTTDFYVKITSTYFEGYIPGETDTVYCPDCDAAVGDKFYGSVTYDDANIPKEGEYRIGFELYKAWFEANDPQDEYQYWAIDFVGPVGRFYLENPRDYPGELLFKDGKLFDIFADDHADIGTPGLELQTFADHKYSALIYAEVITRDRNEYYPRYLIEGDVTINVPEPATLILLGTSLFGILGASRKKYLAN